MFIGVMHPEVIALGVGVRNVSAAILGDLVQQRVILQDSVAQPNPVWQAPTRNHTVDSGERETLVIEMVVKPGDHG